jgi:outer membrane cobalamin receptor
MPTRVILCSLLAVGAAPAWAQDAVELEAVEVTSAKIPVNLRDSTATVTVVDGADLRARGATDLRTALSLVAGVDIAPGGDSGPAGSVPALWGLREFDAFLLVVDGVPWGGAFTPALATLNLNNVERIEVVKGAAPVS